MWMIQIHEDHVDDGDRVGQIFKSVETLSGDSVRPTDTGAKQWTAKDDDGEVYYRGYLIEWGDVLAGEEDPWLVIFEWAAAYAGATSVFDGRGRRVI